jgi:hypothetical protein
MSQEIKLNDELLLEVQTLKDELTENVVKIGRLNVQVSFYKRDLEMMNQELEYLYEEAAKINIREEELQAKVVAEHGEGKLDLVSGIYKKS